MQCCPMDTCDTAADGRLRNTCECDDECTCMCTDCRCGNWGDGGGLPAWADEQPGPSGGRGFR